MDERAKEVIRILTDHTYAAAYPKWMLQAGEGAEDFVKNGFAPRGTDLRDFCLVKRDGVFHFFFIDKRIDATSKTAHQCTIIGHASTHDLVEWEYLGTALDIDPGRWDGFHVCAPNVFEWEGVYYMFYHGHIPTLSQSIGFATSTDLMTWTRYEGNPVLHPGFFD